MIYIRYCDVCKEYNSGINFVLQISDNKNKVQINGHEQCIDELQGRVKDLDYEKLSVGKILEKLDLGL